MKKMNFKKILVGMASAVVGLALFATPAFADKPSDTGFDDNGYNNTANIFNGTGSSWCIAKALSSDCLGIYSPDSLIMKWNNEWVRGNLENWSNPPYRAWENNEWNGNVVGGSGAVWHYKIVWVGSCGADLTPLANGGYCIWGQFEVIMDQGVDPSYGPGHFWFAHANPTGYGAYPQ